jgi:beta-galactosidase
VKAENGDILGEYNLHFTKDKDLLARKPIAAAKQSQLLQLGQSLELPNKVPVYFAGKSGYDVKDLAVEWEKVPASTLNKAGEYTIKGHVVGSEVPVELSVRVTDKVGRSLSDNPDYLATHSQAFASATNDLDDNSNDRVDYLNDNDRNQDNRWTNWSANPSANPEVSVGVIFKKNGKIVDRKVSQAKLNFFADSGTDAPAKLVLERYIGPDFDVPVYYSNYSYESNHPFNNPDNWELVPYYADKEIQAGDEINVTFKPVTTKAMRWRMDRKADKNGVALTELSFRAPSELAKESTEGRILVDGKELPDFSENRLDYELIYKGERPKITVEGKDQVTSTIVDSGNENLPVLVRLVSESGKNVKEYRIKLTKEKVIDGKLVAPAQYDLPSLEVVDKELNFQTLEQKDDTLLEGEVRLLQEGKVGKERIYTEVTTDGKHEEKSREILEEPVNRILLVGTRKKTSNIETPAGGHQDNGSSQPTEQKPGANPNPNIANPNPSNYGVASNSSDFKNHLSVAPNIVIQAPTQESKKPGWNKEDGKWYYRQQNGDLAKGWVKDGDTWYYFDQTGKMETGWIKDQSGTWYYLNQSGAMSSNEWILDQAGKWYYVDVSGSMKTSQWFQVGDKWYYVDENGALAVNTVTPDGYQVNENGEWVG